jgi:hypothetical protein
MACWARPTAGGGCEPDCAWPIHGYSTPTMTQSSTYGFWLGARACCRPPPDSILGRVQTSSGLGERGPATAAMARRLQVANFPGAAPVNHIVKCPASLHRVALRPQPSPEDCRWLCTQNQRFGTAPTLLRGRCAMLPCPASNWPDGSVAKAWMPGLGRASLKDRTLPCFPKIRPSLIARAALDW